MAANQKSNGARLPEGIEWLFGINDKELRQMERDEKQMLLEVGATIAAYVASLPTITETARLAGISRSTLLRRRKAGLLNSYPMPCGCVRFAHDRVAEFAEKERAK